MRDNKRYVKSEMQRKNGMGLGFHIVLGSVLFTAYLIEVIKGNRTVEYFMYFAAIELVPIILNSIVYRRNRESSWVKHIFAIGYSVLYAFVMFTGSTTLTFVYILPLLVGLILYADFKLSLRTGIATFVINVASVIVKEVTVGLSNADIVNAEIQIGVVLLMIIYSILTASMMTEINKNKVEEVQRDKEKITLLLNKIVSASSTIKSGVEDVFDKMERLEESVTLTKESMEQVTEGSNDTSVAIQNQMFRTEAIQQHIANVKQLSGNIDTNMEKAIYAVHVGRDRMGQLTIQSEMSAVAENKVTEELSALEQSMKEMQKIIKMIKNISVKTRVLSLNASIEAARAGEAGKGFAVIANQITLLSNQTADATAVINQLILDKEKSLSEMVQSVKELVNSTSLQNHYAEEAAEHFNHIDACTNSVVDYAKLLVDTLNQLAVANDMIVENIQNISAVTEEVTAHATATYESSKENKETVDKVVYIVKNLQRQADELIAN